MTVGDSSISTLRSRDLRRFTALAGLDDIREMRRRIGDESRFAQRAVEEKQRRDKAPYTQLTSRVETLQKKLSDMEVEATMDPFTCVGNRRRFQLSLTRMVAHAKQTNTPLSLAMVDVDHFKAINDKHGHPIGDRVLLLVARSSPKPSVRPTSSRATAEKSLRYCWPMSNGARRRSPSQQLLIDISSSAYGMTHSARRRR